MPESVPPSTRRYKRVFTVSFVLANIACWAWIAQYAITMGEALTALGLLVAGTIGVILHFELFHKGGRLAE